MIYPACNPVAKIVVLKSCKIRYFKEIRLLNTFKAQSGRKDLFISHLNQ